MFRRAEERKQYLVAFQQVIDEYASFDFYMHVRLLYYKEYHNLAGMRSFGKATNHNEFNIGG